VNNTLVTTLTRICRVADWQFVQNSFVASTCGEAVLIALGRRLIFFISAASNDPQHLVRQRALHTFASSHGARIQTSRSSSVVRITGIVFGWIGSTITFGTVVRKP